MAYYFATSLRQRVEKLGGVDANWPDILSYLGDDKLFVKHEDEVADTVEHFCRNLAVEDKRRVQLWRCVRIGFCSLHVTKLIRDCIQRIDKAVDAPIITFPIDLAMNFMDEMVSKASRMAVPGAHSWGILASLARDSTMFNGVYPRNSYIFSVDAFGKSHLGTGLGLFFIWINKDDPLGNNNVTEELPEKYKANISAWASLYSTQATVLNGSQCYAAVLEASSHPEFHAVTAGGPCPFLQLSDAYSACARDGDWIKCADIGRLACLWLSGRGSTYLDTDMAVGKQKLPPSLWSPAGRTQELSPSLFAAAVEMPLIVLAQDAEGLVQNNFISVGSMCHALLTLLLQACQVSCFAEKLVICGTGPALLTAIITAFKDSEVPHSLTLSMMNIRQVGSSSVEMVPPSMDAVVSVRTSLPESLSEEAFPFLKRVARAHIERFRLETTSAPILFRQCFHICPPSSFYPRHWRVPHEMLSAPGAPVLKFEAIGNCTEGSADVSTADGDCHGLFGTHGWDCTWVDSERGYAQGYSAYAKTRNYAAYLCNASDAGYIRALPPAFIEEDGSASSQKGNKAECDAKVYVSPFLSYSPHCSAPVAGVDDPKADPLSVQQEGVYDQFGVADLAVRVLTRLSCFDLRPA